MKSGFPRPIANDRIANILRCFLCIAMGVWPDLGRAAALNSLDLDNIDEPIESIFLNEERAMSYSTTRSLMKNYVSLSKHSVEHNYPIINERKEQIQACTSTCTSTLFSQVLIELSSAGTYGYRDELRHIAAVHIRPLSWMENEAIPGLHICLGTHQN